jgi:hypothetical protein
MSSYFVDFTAYVDERRRPENFPHEVHVQETFENVESIAQLQYLVNDKFIKLVSSAGLIVLKDPDEPLPSGVVTFDRRIFVNWSLLTHMSVSVKLIADPLVTTQDNLIPIDRKPVKSTDVVN